MSAGRARPSPGAADGAGRRSGLAMVLALALLAGCTGGDPILANPSPARPPATPTAPAASRPPDPVAVLLPRDDLPHDRLTEWWYYTGHLQDSSGGRWGFEFVIFRAERGSFPVSWASHLALTDETGGTFAYDQRAAIGPAVDQSAASDGLALAILGFDPTTGIPIRDEPWLISGLDGRDRLVADSAAAGIGIALQLEPLRPAVLHDLDGYVDFGPAGGSYYYSRTRMAAAGQVRAGSRELAVSGLAWFDHQWGDFIAVGGGGWDWFAVNLDDGTDLTISLVRDASGDDALVYGTLVSPRGEVRNLGRDSFSVTPAGTWTSSRTGATYPSGWRVEVPGERLVIDLAPTVADQELDTRASTGVVYWEGSQRVSATRDGIPLSGEAYVELTGYGPGGGS